MQETNKDRTATMAIVVGVVALLLGLCLGATIGGVGGFFFGRSAAPATRSRQQVLPVQPPRVVPTPQPRELPQLPELPGLGVQSDAFVQEVIEGAPAAEAGLKRGDIVTKVNNTPVDADHKLADVLASYKPGDQLTLSVWRSGKTLELQVKLGPHPDDAKRPYLGIRYTEMTTPRRAPSD